MMARAQSTLLVPLDKAPAVPAEIKDGFPMTVAYFKELETEFQAFNDRCVDELKEMNQTKITNIIERGGVEGWNDGDNLDALTKTFEFESFEQGQAFVQAVGKFCEDKDHHPEWNCHSGGKQISVTLTSHFANNKVTLFDFELAEHMNFQYNDVKSSFKMFPRVTERNLVSLCIGTGSLVLFMSIYNYYTAPHYYEKKEINQAAANSLMFAKNEKESDMENLILQESFAPKIYTERKVL